MDQERPESAHVGVDVGVEPTGLPAVDEVVQRVLQLADRPVAEHVEVFERAQEQLRRALDAPPAARPASQPNTQSNTQPHAVRAGDDDQGA